MYNFKTRNNNGNLQNNKNRMSQKMIKIKIYIDAIILKLNPENVSMQNIDYKYDSFAKNFEQIYKNGKQVWELKSNSKSVIEVCQFFKYKKVPINARLNIAERLIKGKKLAKEKKNDFLSEFGISKSPALDYKNDKENFNLANYPLKVAFDYAWENCAKAIHEGEKIEQCEKYLKDIFDLDTATNPAFQKYADLLYFKILLGRLKAEFHKTDEATNKNNIQKLRNVFRDLNYYGDKRLNKKQIQEVVNAWFCNKEKNIAKKKGEEISLTQKEQDNFSLAMQIIGQERGGLKTRIEKYKTLTDMFKVCASKFGKQFADLRDYFNEAYEVDKDLHLVPAFRSVDNYEKIVRRDKKDGDEYVNYPFGIVRFVDPKYTSKRCPKCGNINVSRDQKTNVVKCNVCKYETKVRDSAETNNIHFITDGDQNGAYHISLKALENLNNK
ncbi:MAG: transposase [Bacteroidales bacterium]|jgi:hypothetical protein|nr:transposase [Bacteroidales bacterium]